MKPQPPVTRMRIAARTSSEDGGALADFPMLRDQLEAWKARLAEVDWIPWVIIGLAAFLRFFLLGIKPPHFDEGINGWFVDQVIKNGFYRYDPTNYHGPLHFYVLLLSQTLFGRNLWALRLPVVLVSIACVWLMMKFEPFVGRTVSRMAALAMAVSPGFVFYGRYSIHEVWLVLFSLLFILGLLGLWKFGTPNYLWCTGMGLAGMILTKETYVIHLGCALIAVPVLVVSNALDPLPDARRAKQTWDYFDLAVVLATGIAVVVFFYSGTFFHWSGVKGLYQAYTAWFATGHEGHGHEKPWHYWVSKLIVRYEWPVLAGLILCLSYQRFKNVSLRYLAIYGVGTLIAYSIVQYKTPWCIVSFIWPFLFIFGAALLVIPLRYRLTTYVISATVLCASLGSTIWLNYFHCTTDSEPYVYVQTYNDIYKLTDPLFTLVRRNPVYYQLTGHIIRTSAYPLPWMLGDFPHIGYYEQENLPAKLDAAFLLVQEDRIAEVESKLHEAYYTEPLRIRAYQDLSKVYFNAKIFKDIFPGRRPEFKGKGSG
ncbi:MAG TPA: hypothetical protein DIT76_01000 [Spartobacteria bacterium]|nr:hypothetical protein [Spartobacteria bacterium]HCP90618.1 hypothetical protein [Spartobacteria bacterium]